MTVALTKVRAVIFRRMLLGAGALTLVSAAPVAAQSYTQILGDGTTRTPTVNRSTSSPTRSLARTGGKATLPMAETAIALVGGGSLLVLVARRRRAAATSSTAG